MIKSFMVVAALLGLTISVQAQHSDYEKTAADFKAEIWGVKDADFESNTVPDSLKNESAVILAKRYDINAKLKKHFRFLNYAVNNKEIIFRYLIRQKVLVQDKTAIGDFSEISYNKISNSSYGHLWGKQSDKLSTYIGAKVYKKNGTVQEVMLSEAVAVKDEKNNTDEKLAIPDLEVGDILDYYIISLQRREMSTLDPMTFIMGGEYPILKFSIHGNIDKHYAMEYKCSNGAPDLKISTDDDGDMQFNEKMGNLPKYATTRWTSAYRQAMLLRLKISPCGGMYSNCTPGEIKKGITPDQIYSNQKTAIRTVAFAYAKNQLRSGEKNYVHDRVKLLKKSMGKEPPADTLISTIYNSLRYYGYYATAANGKIYAGKTKNETSLSDNFFAVILSLMLKDYGIDNELIFFSSRYMPKIEDLMSYDVPVFMVHVKDKKDYYLNDDGIFSQLGLVPGYAEGEKGVTLAFDDVKAIYRDNSRHLDQGTAKIPVSVAGRNKHREMIHITPTLGSTPIATVDRTVIQTGLVKEDLQKKLLLFEDYYKDAYAAQGETQTFIEEYADARRTKSLAEEWQNSFAKSRETYKDGFMSELKDNFESEPKELLTYKVTSSGVKDREPNFIFSTQFVMGDWFKKAGNNYLFEVGKVIGGQLVIKDEDRKRTIDIYGPFARTFEYQIQVDIPAGYSVEGVEALNKSVENDCGSFKSTATVQGDKLTVTTVKEYTHAFEPAANWAKMLVFIDAAADFGTAKLLLKKK